MKRFKLSANSRENAAAPLAYRQYIGLQLDLLSANSNYVKPRPAAGTSCCSIVGGERTNGQKFSYGTGKDFLASTKVLAPKE